MSSAVVSRRSQRIRAVFDKDFGDAYAVRAKHVILTCVQHEHPLKGIIPRKMWRKYRSLILERLLEVLEETFVELCGKDDDESVYRRVVVIPSFYSEYHRLLTNKRLLKTQMLTITALETLAAKAIPQYARAMATSSNIPLEICEVIAKQCPTFCDLEAQLAKGRAYRLQLLRELYPWWY